MIRPVFVSDEEGKNGLLRTAALFEHGGGDADGVLDAMGGTACGVVAVSRDDRPQTGAGNGNEGTGDR